MKPKMNRFLGITCFLLAALLLTGSLHNLWAAEASPPVMEQQEEETDTKEYYMNLKYPLIKEYHDNLVTEAFNELINIFMRETKNKFKTRFESAKADDGIRNQWKLYVELKEMYNQKGFISLWCIESSYEDGAHFNPLSWSFLYDLENQREISLDDFFKPDSGYLKFISEACRKQLMMREDAVEDMVMGGTDPNLSSFSIFYISDDGITIVFPPYQAAPYGDGYLEVFISFDELKDYLNPESSAAALFVNN